MEVKNYNEEEIIEESKKDPKAFEEVYNFYFDRIYQFVNKRLMEEEAAFDITQQVFFNALASLKTYKHKGFPFSSFLYKIAVNECNSHFRNKNKVRYVSIDEASIFPLSEEILPHHKNESTLAQLSQALRSLQHDELFLVELRYFEQRKFKEVAQILGVSENNCKVRVHRIIRKLKKYFNDEE